MQTNSYITMSHAETQLVEAARTGNTDSLIEYLYREELLKRAAGLVNNYRQAYGVHLDAEDVAMEGICEVLRGLKKALTEGRNPIALLIWFAQFKMLHYCQESRSAIRVPHATQSRGRTVPVVLSLDAPLPGTDDLTLLDVIEATYINP